MRIEDIYMIATIVVLALTYALHWTRQKDWEYEHRNDQFTHLDFGTWDVTDPCDIKKVED